MSHFTTIDIQIRDIGALRKACVEMGVPLEENSVARGYQFVSESAAQSHARMTGYDITTDGNGNVQIRGNYVIRLPGQFDIALQSDGHGGFNVLADKSGRCRAEIFRSVGADFGRLKQLYGVHKAISEASKAGLRAMRSIQSDGSIRLTLTK